MEKSDLPKLLRTLENALDRFDEALAPDIAQNSLALDAAIQRFEFAFEFCWKVLKRVLRIEGIETRTPRSVFKEAFKLEWLKEGDEFWQKMIEDRNETSHTYDQKKALEIYSHLLPYSKAYRQLLSFLKQKYLVKS